LYDSEKGTGQYIHVAISSYGAENFFPEVIWAGSVDKLNEKEIYYIKKLHTFVDDPKCNGYNLTTGGGQCEFSAATKASISKSAKTRCEDEVVRDKMRGAQVANWQDPEYRAKMAAIMNSEEYCALQAEQAVANWADEEVRAKMVAGIIASWDQPERLAVCRTAEARERARLATSKVWKGVLLESRNARAIAGWSKPGQHKLASEAQQRRRRGEAEERAAQLNVETTQ
jgi:hypothetical protein